MMINIKSKKTLLDLIEYYFDADMPGAIDLYFGPDDLFFFDKTKISMNKNTVTFTLFLGIDHEIQYSFEGEPFKRVVALEEPKPIAKELLMKVVNSIKSSLDCINDVEKYIKNNEVKKSDINFTPHNNIFSKLKSKKSDIKSDIKYTHDYPIFGNMKPKEFQKIINKKEPVGLVNENNFSEETVKLGDSSFLYQNTHGTSEGSVYKVIAIGANIAVSARYISDKKLSVRIEPVKKKTTKVGFNKIINNNFEGFTLKEGSYASIHVNSNPLETKRILASVIASVPSRKTDFPEMNKISKSL